MSSELAARPRILIVDDDPLIRRVIIQSLDRNTYELLEAESGTVGVNMALQHRPDLIILDIIMPGLDGFEVIHILRRHPLTQNIPIIMLTGLGEMSEKVRGMQLGADDYITKPFDPRELRARVQAHLKRSEQYLQSSPLTSLPGNMAIQQIMAVRIASGEPLAVMYLDLSHFKMFNDKYGWLAGDQVLKEMGEIIVQVVLSRGDKDDFVGHVGGDDFVIVTRPQCAEEIAQRIIHDFDERVPLHYNSEDRARGYMEGEDRDGVVRQAPIITLAVAIVTNEHRELYHPQQVAQLAAEVKKYLKTLPGSQYGLDRRRK